MQGRPKAQGELEFGIWGAGYGLQWGVRLSLLFVDALFISHENRGVDLFNYVFQIATLGTYLALWVLLRRSCSSGSFQKMFSYLVVWQIALALLGVGLVVIAPFMPFFSCMSALAAGFLGLGLGAGTLCWFYLFSRQGCRRAGRSLAISWLTGLALFALLAYLSPMLRLIGIIVACTFSGFAEIRCWFLVRDAPRCSIEPKDEAELCADPSDCVWVGKEKLPYIFFAEIALSFIYGISGPLLFSVAETSTGDVVRLLGHFGSIAAAIVLACFAIRRLVLKRIDVVAVFQIAFTVDVLATLVLLVVGDSFAACYNVAVQVAFRTTGLLMSFVCVGIASTQRFCHVAPLLLACGSVGLVLGVGLGDALFTFLPAGSTALLVAIFCALYAIFMVVTVSATARIVAKQHPDAVPVTGDSKRATCPAEKDDDVLGPTPGGLALAVRQFALSEREAAVMDFLARGRSVAFAAQRLGLSQNTVKTYARTLYRKLGVHSRQELMDLVDRLGR